MIFSKNESSGKIQKKIDGLQADIAKVADLLSSKEAEIEQTIASGGSSDKLFEAAGILRSKTAAMSSVLSKMQAEYSSAMAREERLGQLRALSGIETAAESLFKKLSVDQAALIAAVRSLSANVDSFNSQAEELKGIGGDSLNFQKLTVPDAGFLLQAAVMGRRSMHNFDDDLQAAIRDMDLNLHGCRAQIGGKLDSARAELREQD